MTMSVAPPPSSMPRASVRRRRCAAAPRDGREDGCRSRRAREARGGRPAPARARGGATSAWSVACAAASVIAAGGAERRARGVAGRRRGRADAHGGLEITGDASRRDVPCWCPLKMPRCHAHAAALSGSGGDSDRSGGSRAERVRRRAARSRTAACRVVERALRGSVCRARAPRRQ